MNRGENTDALPESPRSYFPDSPHSFLDLFQELKKEQLRLAAEELKLPLSPPGNS